jgi:hypothetical protein
VRPPPGGGGGPVGGNDACSGGCGTALLTITDAPGDFLSYTIDVTSLQLKKANGATVQTLPVTSRIDFAQLVDLDEVLSAGQIPAGNYISATLNVDYSNASIVVDDGTGTGVTVAPVNASGTALGQVSLNVELDNRNHLVITPGRVARLAFDLNLAASNTVDLAGLRSRSRRSSSPASCRRIRAKPAFAASWPASMWPAAATRWTCGPSTSAQARWARSWCIPPPAPPSRSTARCPPAPRVSRRWPGLPTSP